MGECPPWYRLVKAAQYLQVAPWDLAKAPMIWVGYAEAAREAEAHLQKIQEKNQRHAG